MVRWRLCSPGHVRSLSPTRKNAVTPSSFLAPTEGGVRSWVILLFPQTGTARSKTGVADTTMSMDGAAPTTTTRQALKAATVELRWTGPKTCERWRPHKNGDDGNQPSLLASTSKADVSTKVAQSSLVQCARLDPFSDDKIIFDKDSRDVVHLGKWSDTRRNALATSIFALSYQKSSTSAKCDTTLGIASIKNCPVDVKSPETIGVCVAACLRVATACISSKIPFCLVKPLGS